MTLPAPKASLVVENVSAGPPGVQKIVIQDVTFGLKAGQGLGIIGPSASGKSSLARAIVGVWTPVRGKVRLDGAALDQWAPADARPRISAICRRTSSCSPARWRRTSRASSRTRPSDAVIAAAQAAGVHEMIVRLPEGYDTQIGEAGAVLSAGQRQRVALARALYRDPFLVVLDEPIPTSMPKATRRWPRRSCGVRSRGGIVIVVAHRPSALAGVDQVLAMVNGRATPSGPRDEGSGEVVAAGAAGRAASPSPVTASRGARPRQRRRRPS